MGEHGTDCGWVYGDDQATAVFVWHGAVDWLPAACFAAVKHGLNLYWALFRRTCADAALYSAGDQFRCLFCGNHGPVRINVQVCADSKSFVAGRWYRSSRDGASFYNRKT